MTLKLLNYITGYHNVCVCSEDAEKAMNILLEYSFIYSTPIRDKYSDGALKFNIIARHINDFRRICKDRNVNCQTGHVKGVPRLLELYRKRLGVFVGIIYFFVMLWMSTLFIWDVTVIGNSNIPDSEIADLLNDLGCGVGSFIPGIDFDELHNRYLLESPDIAWIAVNMKGVVAEVEVREIMYGSKKSIENEKTAANIVAACDGQIESVEVYEGRKAVFIGDIVKKGDLLISGVVESGVKGITQNVFYKKAEGKVLAKVNKEILIVIPLVQEQKVATGNTESSYLINIFGKNINISPNSGISEASYDKIISERKLTVFGEVTLPVNIITETYNEYEIQKVTISKDEAVELAFKQLRAEMDAALSGEDTQLLERETDATFDDDNFYLRCNLYCIENIAESVPFSFD